MTELLSTDVLLSTTWWVRAAVPSLPFDGLLYKLCRFLGREISSLGVVPVVLVLVAACGCSCLSPRHSNSRKTKFFTVWRTLSCNSATIQIVLFEKWDKCYSWKKEIKNISWDWIWAKMWNASMGRSSLKWKRTNWDRRKLDTDCEWKRVQILPVSDSIWYLCIYQNFLFPPSASVIFR